MDIPIIHEQFLNFSNQKSKIRSVPSIAISLKAGIPILDFFIILKLLDITASLRFANQ